MRRSPLVLVVLAAFTGCPRGKAPADAGVDAAIESDAGVAGDAGAAAGAGDAGAAQDAGVDGGAGPAELTFSAELLLADGGTASLPMGPRVEIEPLAGFTLHFGVELTDYRVRVIDGADQVVPSDDEAHDTDAGTDYQAHFLKPLRPAHTYHLQIDAQNGPEIGDQTGRTYRDVDLELKTLGQPEPAPGKKHKHR